MKKNWIRLLTMLLAAMLILTMSGVVSLANDDQPVTGDGVSDVSDTISPVKTEEEPSVDESSTGASSEDEGSKGPSSEDVSSEGSSSEGSSSEDASSKDASSKDASSKDASSEDISSEECTCGATEGEVHKEGCPLYTEPEEKPSEAVQAVIDMIEALPDTDTVANYEPAVDLPEDDEGYNDAYNEAYSAYLEEAKENYAAAQEAYNALTDEEKAEIPEELTGKLVDFAGFIAMLGQVNTLDLDNASGGPEYYEEFGTKKAPFFFANGTPITITETGADGMGAKITWDGGEKDVPANTNVFGGYHNSDTSCTTSIIMIGGRLNSLFGGGLHKSHVTKATITISGGAVPGQVAGGGASSMTNGCSDDCSYTNAWYSGDAKDSPCRVDEAVVTIEGGNDYLLVFGGGEGISSTGTATLNISGGDMSGAYVTAGGSNGYTGSGTVNVSGSANIKVLQGVNRGGMDAIKLNVTGGTVKNMYAGGESGDASVTGTFAQSDVTVSGGTVKTLRAGTNGGAEITDMSGITATITPSAVEDNQLTDKLVAEVSGVDYPSLDAAVKAAKNGDVIKLLSGYTAETADDIVTIPEGLSITLDLAGKTIDVGSSFAGRPLINRGTLTITGNGTIDSSASLSGRGAIDNYGTITIENGTYTGNVYADGWYSGRIAAFYENNDYDTKKEAEVSKAEIKGYIDTYKNDHKAFTSFLSKKVASQWNNPEFQCFWITNVRSSDIEKSPVISDILSLKGSSTFIAFLNIMQSIILLGSMLYAVNTLIEGTFAGAAVLPLTFIGGFIFHLFWEGKCQYTLPYFMLLLPLSIIGFYSMAKKLSSVTKKHLYKCGVFAVILLFIAIIFNRFIILNQDNKSYRQYREYTIEQQKL